jgi:hypothetical protein
VGLQTRARNTPPSYIYDARFPCSRTSAEVEEEEVEEEVEVEEEEEEE